MKFIFFCLLLSLVNLQDKEPNVELGKMEENQCSTDIGKLNFKFKFQYTSEDVINSYFLLNLRDQNSQKHSMICKVEVEESKENKKNYH